jgi:hypothetical protein
LASIAVQTAVVDVLASGEFCSARRRVRPPAHHVRVPELRHCHRRDGVQLFDGFHLPHLWWIGGLMVCIGGYWFWFFIRADVAAEGNSPLRLMRADLFVLSLLASVTLGLVWAFLQANGSGGAMVFFGLYILATTVLFGSVPWSKFAHMFFKPAAAFEKRGLVRERHAEQSARAGRQAGAVRQRAHRAAPLLRGTKCPLSST